MTGETFKLILSFGIGINMGLILPELKRSPQSRFKLLTCLGVCLLCWFLILFAK